MLKLIQSKDSYFILFTKYFSVLIALHNFYLFFFQVVKLVNQLVYFPLIFLISLSRSEIYFLSCSILNCSYSLCAFSIACSCDIAPALGNTAKLLLSKNLLVLPANPSYSLVGLFLPETQPNLKMHLPVNSNRLFHFLLNSF